MTSKLDFDKLIIEICSNDVRCYDGLNNIKQIFRNNRQLFAERVKGKELIISFHAVHSRFNVTRNIFEDIFAKGVNVDKKVKDFYEALPLLSGACIRHSENFKLILLDILRRHCKCINYKEDADTHLLANCSFGESSGVKKNHSVIEAIINCVSDIFKDKVVQALKPFQNPDVGILVGSELIFSHKEKFIDLNNAAEEFYNNLAEIFRNYTYETYTDDDKRNFHLCLMELISLETKKLYYPLLTNNTESLKAMHSFLKTNATKLGIYYYIRLMHKLVMVGWYGIDEFHNEIKQIASLETIWLNDNEELSEINGIFNELFFSSTNRSSEREDILNNLKKLGKYIKLMDFNDLMTIFNDKHFYQRYSPLTFDNFYNTLNRIYGDTLKHGFKRN